jgi:hypothetical protein
MTHRRVKFRCLSGMILFAMALLSAQPRMFAQTDGSGDASLPANNPSSDATLPEKPQPQSLPLSANVQPFPADGSASISGVVQDLSGATVAGAGVTLADANGSQRGTVMSGANGEFAFSQIPAGSYRVAVDAKDLEPFQSAEIVVTEQQAYEMPAILLRVARASTQLTVRPTEEVAAEQVKAQEQQRILGIVPNFYTSFVYDAAPLTTRQKYSLVSHNVFDPIEFISAGITAGIGQRTNRFPGYGQGAAGYGKRYGAAFGDALTRNYLSFAVLPSLFHQDPRYFYQGTGSAKSRLVHALGFAFVLRGDNGHAMPNYSFLLGVVGSGLLSNLYYPREDRGARLVFTNAAIGIGVRAGGGVLREFLSRRFTNNVPGNGKPEASNSLQTH